MKRILPVFLILLVIWGCSSTRAIKNLSSSEMMQIANDYFNRGKYHKAIPYYSEVVLDRRSNFTAEAQMRLGDCYFNQNKFLEARFEYEELIRLFKNYPEISRAYFNIGVCYFEESLSSHYTQEETRKAIDAFETYLVKFPLDENREKAQEYITLSEDKLLEKKYYNGYAYYKLWDYSSALLYFDEITQLDRNDDIHKMALYYSGMIHLYRKDKANALLVLTKMSQRYPEARETRKISELFEKIR